jgi:hypothetical protein
MAVHERQSRLICSHLDHDVSATGRNHSVFHNFAPRFSVDLDKLKYMTTHVHGLRAVATEAVTD